MTHELDRLFCPRHIAVVGAGPNDAARMGTRTLYDLVESGWNGDIYPVSSRYDTLYGLPVYRSLRDVPQAPDVVIARTPSAGIEVLIDDAVSVGAGFLIILAAGFAESGAEGEVTQRRLIERARRGGLRIVGPQSIGLVHCTQRLPISLSQIMERLTMNAGEVALLTQSGAMAIQLAVRGQTEIGLNFSCIATFGNSADVSPIDALDWFATDPHTKVIGMYLEGIAEGDHFARAVSRCQDAGKQVVILRSGLSKRGATAVASHTASMSGDADTFRALCRQIGVVLCTTSEEFLWAVKGCASAARVEWPPRVAFASVSGGACALWADHSEILGLELPVLDAEKSHALQTALPPFLSAANPLDIGPAAFDDESFAATLYGLIQQPEFDILVVYMFTSSPTLMGGLRKIGLLETLAREVGKPVWVIWEAATPEEWKALASSDAVVGFRDLGLCAQALAVCSRATRGADYVGEHRHEAVARISIGDATEPVVKAWLRDHGLNVPRGYVCADARAAAEHAEHLQGTVAVKIVSPQIIHKSDIGGVQFCSAERAEIARCAEVVLETVRARLPQARLHGLLVEERIVEAGLELFATVRRDKVFGLVTVVGRGGVQIEVDPDYVVHVGALPPEKIDDLLAQLRCAALLRGHRGRPALNTRALGKTIAQLQAAMDGSDLHEIEINPLLLTAHKAWVLDAIARGPDDPH